MQELVERMRIEAQYLGRGIIKADGLINHQLYPDLTMAMGRAFAERFDAAGVTGVNKIVTAEVSGIPPALATGVALNVPIIYARKKRPITMGDEVWVAEAPSHTKGGITPLIVSPSYLGPDDRVLLIDDFLATGNTIKALLSIVKQSGAELLGIGCIVEKVFQPGREALAEYNVPIITLVKIDLIDEKLKIF